MRSSWHFWLSTMATNLAIAALAATMIWLVGLGPFLLVQLPITLLAGSIGVWLFYVQHQFEDTVWAHDEGWNFREAALHGSSHYDLPGVLRWFTVNIGVHDVHHLCSPIPYYRLPRVLRDHPELFGVGPMAKLRVPLISCGGAQSMAPPRNTNDPNHWRLGRNASVGAHNKRPRDCHPDERSCGRLRQAC